VRFSETDVPNPQDAYAVSKWDAEQALKQVAADTGLEIVILRPPLVYGPGVKANFLRLLAALAKGIPLPLASVNNRRSFIYLDNLVHAIKTCMTHPNAAGQTYLVSDGEDVSIPDLIRRLAQALGRPARLWPFPPAALKAAAALMDKSAEASRLLDSLQADTSKIRNELGWNPPYSMSRGFDETAAWYLESLRAAP
ncbi:MAG: NAD-dependent epimerase/dehydratase family protein, partial [Burkholderiales bacterium]